MELIERVRPDLALLGLQMPDLDGLGVVRVLRKERLPLVAFVTAYDEHAVAAFEANAIDYLLKAVEAGRLRRTLSRAHERLEQADFHTSEVRRRLTAASQQLDETAPPSPLRRIPVRRRDDIVFVPVDQLAAITAGGEMPGRMNWRVTPRRCAHARQALLVSSGPLSQTIEGRQPSGAGQTVQDRRNTGTRPRGGHHDPRTFAGEAVHDGEAPEDAPSGERVMHEVHRPALTWPRRHLRRDSASRMMATICSSANRRFRIGPPPGWQGSDP